MPIVPTEVICVCAASTASTPLVAVNPVPPNKVARASTVDNCSVEPSESNIASLSPLAGVAFPNSDKSNAKDTVPLVPPPLNPTPAVTPAMSPVSVMLRTPLLALNPEPAIPATKSATLSFLDAFESSASIRTRLSFATLTVAAVNSFKSNAKVNAPEFPPPLSPFPAVTESMSPTLELMYELNCDALIYLFVPPSLTSSLSLSAIVIPVPSEPNELTSANVATPVSATVIAPENTLSIHLDVPVS